MKTGRAPTKPKRTRLSPDERRAQLVRAASRLLDKRGVDGLSYTELAARAGVTRPVVYRFFPTRRALVLAVLSDFEEELTRRFVAAASRGLPGSVAEVTRLFVDAVCDTIDEKGAFAWHQLDERGPDAVIARRGTEIIDRLMAPWRGGIAARTGASAAEAETLAVMLVAAGRAVLERWYRGAITRDEAARDATRGVSALLEAFTPPETPAFQPPPAPAPFGRATEQGASPRARASAKSPKSPKTGGARRALGDKTR